MSNNDDGGYINTISRRARRAQRLPEYIGYLSAVIERKQVAANYQSPSHPSFDVDGASQQCHNRQNNEKVNEKEAALVARLHKEDMADLLPELQEAAYRTAENAAGRY